MSKFNYSFTCKFKNITNKMSNFTMFLDYIDYFHISESEIKENQLLDLENKSFDIFFRVKESIIRNKRLAHLFI